MRTILTILLLLPMMLSAQTTFPLYPGTPPNSIPGPDEEKWETGADSILRISKVSRPTLTVYAPPPGKSNGTSVIVLPGGGYWILAAGHEGADVARKLTESGITAFVLKYRLPDSATMPVPEIGPLQDVQQAIKTVRERAARWGLRTDRIGVLGFSAGGHLAATAGTLHRKPVIPNGEGTSLRPDFLVLVYPVISFSDSIGHAGSRDKLLGAGAPPEKVRQYSAELQVDRQTPPTFLVHADDDWVKVENSIQFAAALQRSGVRHHFLRYPKGGHGFGMVNPVTGASWMSELVPWIISALGS